MAGRVKEMLEKSKEKREEKKKSGKGGKEWFTSKFPDFPIKKKSKSRKEMDFLKNKDKPFYVSEKKAKKILDKHAANVAESFVNQGRNLKATDF